MAVYSKLEARYLPLTQRAVVLFKPDGILDARKGLMLLSRSLMDRGASFRFASPAVTSLSPETAKAFWPSDEPRFKNHRAFMTCSHPQDRIISAPSLSVIVEARNAPGFNLVDTLRCTDVVGPTSPEDILGTLDDKDTKAQNIKKSARYLLTLGQGARMWPSPWDSSCPMYNRFHCSASDDEARWELALLYAKNPDILRSSYSDGAAVGLVSHFNELPISTDKKVPLLGMTTQQEILDALNAVFCPAAFRDFGPEERAQLAFETSALMPFLMELSDAFIENLSGSSARPVRLPQDTSGMPSPKPVFIAICGDSGSGKNEQVRLLTGSGYSEVVQYTNREMKPGETEGVSYRFVSTQRLLDMIAQNRLAGVDRINGNLYGVSFSQLHPGIMRPGTKLVTAAGPNTIAGIRSALAGRANFGAAFLSVSPEQLSARIKGRDRDSEADLARRLEWIKASLEQYAPRLPEFESVLDGNRSIEEVGQTIRSFAENVGQGGITHTDPNPASYRMTPKKRRVQWLFDMGALKAVIENRASISEAPIGAIEEKATGMITDPYTLFIEELYRGANAVPYLNKAINHDIQEIILPHIINVYSASRQIFSRWEAVAADERRLGRLFEMGQTERGKMNLERIRKYAETISPYERDLIVLLHDIGKVVSFVNHQPESARLIDAFELMEYTNLDEKTAAMDTLFFKYHGSVGDYAYCFVSWMSAFVNMFQEPSARQLFINTDGSVDISAINAFLNRHRFFVPCDVAGSCNPWGGIVNTNLELYYSIIDRIENIFKQNSASYETAIEKLIEAGKFSAKEQLSGLLLGFDDESDKWEDGVEHYWGLINQGVDTAVSRGLFNREEWESFMEKLPFIDNKYTPHFWWMYFGPNPETGGEKVYGKPGGVPPASIFNSYAMISGIIDRCVPGFGPGRTAAVVHFDRDGREIAGRGKEIEAAWEGHRVFDRARSFEVNSNTITFLDENGEAIDGIRVVVSHEPNKSILRFEYTNLSFIGRDTGEY